MEALHRVIPKSPLNEFSGLSEESRLSMGNDIKSTSVIINEITFCEPLSTSAVSTPRHYEQPKENAKVFDSVALDVDITDDSAVVRLNVIFMQYSS